MLRLNLKLNTKTTTNTIPPSSVTQIIWESTVLVWEISSLIWS